MNLRGLSCWMLPSQPRFTLRLLPCDQRALTADPPRRCIHLLPSPVRFTVLAYAGELFHASSEAPSRRLSASAGRSSLDGRSAAQVAACGDGAASASG